MGSASCSLEKKQRTRDLGERRKKGTPKLTGKGKMLEVETSKGKPAGTQAKRATRAQPSSGLPRPGSHQPWEMSRRFGDGVWFDLLFFFCLFIYNRLKLGRRPAQARRRDVERQKERRCARRLPLPLAPPLDPALRLPGILALPLPLPSSPRLRKTLIVAR